MFVFFPFFINILQKQVDDLFRLGVQLNRTKAVEVLGKRCETMIISKAFPIACWNGNSKMVTTLLKLFPAITATEFAKPGLLVAIKKGHTKLMEAVIPYFTQGAKDWAPHLFRATKKGFWGITDALLSAGWFPPSRNEGSIVV